jgi:predicted dehydrogenase
MKFSFHRKITAGALALAVGAGSAQGGLIFSETKIPVSGDGDTTFYDDDNDFSLTFDFSSLDIDSVDYFDLILVSSGFNDESKSGGWWIFSWTEEEDWRVRAQGSNGSASWDDTFFQIDSSTQRFTFDTSTDGPWDDAFSHTVDTQVFTVWLAEESSDRLLPNPSITVNSVTLEVYGALAQASEPPAPVSTPPTLPLVLAGFASLGAFGRLRRRNN